MLLSETTHSKHYDAATATYDIYVLFLERGMALLSPSGRLGYILPNKFFSTDYGEACVEFSSRGSC